MTNEYSPTVDFLIRLKKLDRAGLTVRDALVLYTIIHNPGISGVHIADMVGAGNRSNIAFNVQRLAREGFIEDRRQQVGKAHPTMFHVLPAGLKFWNDLKP